MAYITGSANSFSDLLSALRNACTANGWTLSGEVLHKGTCFVRTRLGEDGSTVAPLPPTNTKLIIQAGTGKDGSNILTGYPNGALAGPRLGLLSNGATYPDWDWPVTYHIHVHSAPDEVFMMVNYDGGQRFQHVMFGQSPAPGNPGTGNWHSGSIPQIGRDHLRTIGNAGVSVSGEVDGYASAKWCPIPFYWASFSPGYDDFDVQMNFHVHGCISTTDTVIWSTAVKGLTPGAYEGDANACTPLQPLLAYSPNLWNNEAILFPIQVMQYRPSSKVSIICEIEHMRYIRNNFIADGTVLTYGPDKWKVYSCYKKNALFPNGAGGGDGDPSDHSGTFAVAIRYDGP